MHNLMLEQALGQPISKDGINIKAGFLGEGFGFGWAN